MLRPLVGDRVEWIRKAGGRGVIVRVLDRDRLLTRIDARGREEPIAANVTQLIAVIAPEPGVDWLLLDRYLAAAELSNLKAVIVLNKGDLIDSPLAELEDYRTIEYRVIETSAKLSVGIEALIEVASDQLSVMVGQSGVGKSTLMNAMIEQVKQPTGELTRKGRQGRHTTTASLLSHLPGGGDLIDSPGVRQYAPYLDDEKMVEHGYREFANLLGSCRFDDCRHLAEPDCAIKRAVAESRISDRRYRSYVNLFELTRSLRAKREQSSRL